ncbi:MAG TPA: methylmalonyl-CoA mutase family protein [Roseiarcus sp.]|nr:methylmalonyl-CoA mutase family protein [Roseiarcus sp.]
MTGFAESFAPTSEEQWRKLVASALKGGAFERLVAQSEDGFPIAPLYRRKTGPRAGRAGGPWRILARMDHPDAESANAQGLEDLAGGADGLEIVFAGAIGAHGYGLAKSDAAALDLAFKNTPFGATRLELDLGPAGEPAARAVADHVSRESEPHRADLSFGLDPIGALALSGRGREWREAAGATAAFARDAAAMGFVGPFVAADGRLVHAAGGSPGQELAFALAAALTYLRALEAGGLSLEAAREAIGFRLAADADEFISLAKFRALRLLWARIEEACGLIARGARLHGASAWRMMTARDPHVNVLRAAMAAFSAGLGGADSVSILPFTQALGLPDAFSRRLARNTQLLLLEESHLGFVDDPAGGAGAFEALTQALCDKAWALFQEIERQGGIVALLERGAFQADVARIAEARARDIATRKATLTGLSDFPDLAEIKPETLAVAKPTFAYQGADRAPPLTPHRLSEPYEALRDASDAMLAARGPRPRVFLANLGPVAAFNARATFAKSLFEAGGVEALSNDGFAGAAEAAAAFKQSGARLACLCSSDEIYAASGKDAAGALRTAGARVWMAMEPGQHEAAWRAAGVESFIFAGCDALAALSAAHRYAGSPTQDGVA